MTRAYLVTISTTVAVVVFSTLLAYGAGSTAILKGNGSGGFTAAVADVDYASASGGGAAAPRTTIYAQLQAGADLGAKLNACFTAVLAANTEGGVCDAQGVTSFTISTQTIVPQGVTVILPAGIITCSQSLGSSDCIIARENSRVLGVGHGAPGVAGTRIKADNTGATFTGTLLHQLSASGTSQWVHHAEVGQLTIDGNSVAANDIFIDRCGEGDIIHDVFLKNATVAGINDNNSNAGCAGFHNVNVVGSACGIQLNGVTSKLRAVDISGDDNTSQWCVNASADYLVLDIMGDKAETFTAGKNDPWMLINSSSKQPSVEITNANLVGPTNGTGACTMPFKTGPIGTPLAGACDMIKITNGGADVFLHNVNANYFLNGINDVNASATRTINAISGMANYAYGGTGDSGAYEFQETTGTKVNPGMGFRDSLTLKDGLYGNTAVKAVTTPLQPVVSTQNGATGGLTVHTYCIAKGMDGTITPVSPLRDVTNANATRTTTNYINIDCTVPKGAAQVCATEGTGSGAGSLVACTDTATMSFAYNNANVELYDYGQTFGSITAGAAGGTGNQTIAGGVVVGAPTGGNQGVGTINATGVYVNGSVIGSTSAFIQATTASVGLSFYGGL